MITFLSSPKPFTGVALSNQMNAIRSWLALGESEVILFGDSEGSEEAARDLGIKWVPDIQTNEQGTPLFGAIAEYAAHHARYDLQIYINCDILMGNDLLSAIKTVTLPRFLLSGSRIDLGEGEWVDTTVPTWKSQVIEMMRTGKARLHYGGNDYFAFPRGLWNGLPSIAIGRAGYDNALMAFCLERDIPIVDLTFSVLALHQFHDYSHVAGGKQQVYNGQEAAANISNLKGFVPNIADSSWELRSGKLHRVWSRGDWMRSLEVYFRFRRPSSRLLPVVVFLHQSLLRLRIGRIRPLTTNRLLRVIQEGDRV